MMKFLQLAVLSSAFFAPPWTQADGPDMVTVPLEGLYGKCCERLVAEALHKAEGVALVSFDKAGGITNARIGLKRGFGLALSSVDKALIEANTHLRSHTGTRYGIAKSLSLTEVHFFRTRFRPDEVQLRESLGKLPGFRTVRVYEGGFSPSFVGKNLPSVEAVKDEVTKDAMKRGWRTLRVAITDLILAASREGARYACPMHPENASALPIPCPECGMKMERVEASVQLAQEASPLK